ncbi:20221_t:CDS:10, partial [Gigaspora margarita]
MNNIENWEATENVHPQTQALVAQLEQDLSCLNLMTHLWRVIVEVSDLLEKEMQNQRMMRSQKKDGKKEENKASRPIDNYEHTTILVTVGTKTITSKAIVTEATNYAIIIGNNWMRKAQAQLDWEAWKKVDNKDADKKIESESGKEEETDSDNENEDDDCTQCLKEEHGRENCIVQKDPNNWTNKQDLDNPLQALKKEQIELVLKAVHEDPVSRHLEEKTMWPEVWALQDCFAESVVTFFLEDIISQHGCPHEILSDQGTHFFNKNKAETSIYIPLANQWSHRDNWTICEALAKCISQYHGDWDNYLHPVLLEVALPVELEVETYPVE